MYVGKGECGFGREREREREREKKEEEEEEVEYVCQNSCVSLICCMSDIC